MLVRVPTFFYYSFFYFDECNNWVPKARFVVKGYQQIHGIDYSETHASVARLESIRIVCTIATSQLSGQPSCVSVGSCVSL
jgi:hypothetical protein